MLKSTGLVGVPARTNQFAQSPTRYLRRFFSPTTPRNFAIAEADHFDRHSKSREGRHSAAILDFDAVRCRSKAPNIDAIVG